MTSRDPGVRPIIPLIQTGAVKKGWDKPPHGEWRFAGADPGRGAAKWRRPTAMYQFEQSR